MSSSGDLAYRDRSGQPTPVKFVSYIWKRIDGHIVDVVKRELGHEKLLRDEAFIDWANQSANDGDPVVSPTVSLLDVVSESS